MGVLEVVVVDTSLDVSRWWCVYGRRHVQRRVEMVVGSGVEVDTSLDVSRWWLAVVSLVWRLAVVWRSRHHRRRVVGHIEMGVGGVCGGGRRVEMVVGGV